MRFSLNWLKKYLDTNLSIYELANKMTAIGLEVESVAAPEKIFEKFQLAEIEKVEDHPNADRLHLCTVRNKDGKTRRIVCGAYNVRVGLKTVLALEGAYIPGKNFVLKKNKIRGIVSEGMMCSREELCMPPKEPDGIIDLGDHISLDDNIGDVLGYDGGIFDVSITPNRGDCFSVKGIARDLAAAGAGIFIEHEISDCHTKFDFPLNIVCDYNNEVANYAPMMSFRVIRNIHNQESPEWLKRALQIAGINSISLIVDLANWYMIDSGRPLHIYDLDKIEGNFHIRFAKHLEDFVDLKKNAYELRTDMLIAADDNDPLCVLGIIGGDKIACSLDTKNILIESALFDQICISKTGNTIDLMSDARMRNERGIDKASCNVGLEAISNLILFFIFKRFMWMQNELE